MALTPRAMLRIALLMRDGGRYDGEQIISQDWVRASTEPRAFAYSGLSYGYGWFLSETGYVIARALWRADDRGEPRARAGRRHYVRS
jgi:CubicO group peptidase (beta-lactamase class C family)